MSDSYFINDYMVDKSSPKMMDANAAATQDKKQKRKRFDSVSTNSSCGDTNANTASQQQQQQPQYDSRFEPRQIPDVLVKKSFLSSQYTSNNNNNVKSSTSMGCSSMSSTGKRGSYLSATSNTYQIILAIRINSDDPYEDFVYRCFPEVEMALEDDLSVEWVTREIIEKLNNKMTRDLRQKGHQANLKSCQLLHAINESEECFEIAQASKNGEPKGCSFDRHQILRNIKCKSRLCLKVLDCAAFDPIIFRLLNKQPSPKKYDFDVSPIVEQEDDIHSIARATSHYKDSLIQKDMDFGAINQFTNSSFSQQPTRSSQTSTINQQIHLAKQNSDSSLDNSASMSPTTKCAPKAKKPSLWSRIFKCGVICQ